MNQRAPERTPVAAVSVRELLLWLFRKRKRVRVDGNSMSPTLQDGDHVLIRSQARAEPNDIVLCRHPYKKTVQVIKRVESADECGAFLLGDAPQESTDSRSFGVVPWNKLVGVVTIKLP